MITVYISIGNSDDKLTQIEYSQFWIAMAAQVIGLASKTHGAWFSNPVGSYQNCCWCVEFPSEAVEKTAREEAAAIGRRFRQESIAWATAETDFL